MLSASEDHQDIIQRIAAVDIGKAELVCCVRVPDENHPGKRLQEITTYSTMTRSLKLLVGLSVLGWTRKTMARRMSVFSWRSRNHLQSRRFVTSAI